MSSQSRATAARLGNTSHPQYPKTPQNPCCSKNAHLRLRPSKTKIMVRRRKLRWWMPSKSKMMVQRLKCVWLQTHRCLEMCNTSYPSYEHQMKYLQCLYISFWISCAMSGVIFPLGRMPPWPGFAPWDNLISTIFTLGIEIVSCVRTCVQTCV